MTAIQFPEFGPELALAIACSRWPFGESVEREIRSRAAAAPIDWRRFLDWVRRNRIAPLAYHNLRQTGCPSIPNDVVARLQSEAAQNARRVLTQIAEAVRITRLLATAGIRSMIIKGPVLSLLAFDDPALRQSQDIDLLVEPDRVAEVDRLIAQAGYRRIAPIVELTPPRYELYRRWRCQSGYYLESLDVILELHWRLTSNSLLLPFDAATMWNRSRQVRVGGTSLATLPDEELFLYLCAHGSVHMWFRLKWLADIAALLQRLPPAVIGRIANRAQTLGMERLVHVTLILANDLMAAPAPPEILRKARADRTARRLAVASHRALAWHGSPGEPSKTLWFNTWLSWHAFRLNASLRYRWRELQHQMWSPEDWARVRLPEQLLFLYLLLRPLCWLMRKIQRIVSR